MTRKLAVCYPWASPFIWTACVESMLNLRHPHDTEVKYFRGGGWCSARRHLECTRQAVDWGADWILILGADQVYEPDLLERLMARTDEGYDCLAAFVPARCFLGWQDMRPFQPMAWRFKSMDRLGADQPRQYRGMKLDRDLIEVVDPKPGDPAMQKINFIGSGVLMFHRDHLLNLQDPWFYETYNPVTLDRLASMDTRFVWRLQWEAMADVWLDTSIKVKHIHPFHIDESFQTRFMDWSEKGVGDVDICQFLPETTTEGRE